MTTAALGVREPSTRKSPGMVVEKVMATATAMVRNGSGRGSVL
jgi:hypothetical protein